MPITRKKQFSIKKAIAVFMLFTIINQALIPNIAYALTSGATAPEATNFEPIDTTDMVNPLSGSFTYNLPLIEVPGPEGGYPLSLSYHAGIEPNEEASWVGLGWSLNPGAIARNVNGYPDDWSSANGAGGNITNYWAGNSQSTYSIGINIGIAGTPASVNVGLSFSQDTYKGFGVGMNLGVGYNFGGVSDGIGNYLQGPLDLGVRIGVSPYGEGYAGTDVSYSSGLAGNGGLRGSASIGLNTNFSSISENLSGGLGNSILGASISTSSMKPSFTFGGGAATSAVDVNQGKISSSSNGFFIPVPIVPGVTLSLGYQHTRYWSNTSSTFTANGVLNNRSSINSISDLYNGDDDNYSLLDPVNTNIIDKPDPVQQLGGTYPNFDNYSVSGQGIGGNIRPYIFASILFNQNNTNNPDHNHDVLGENLPSSATPGTVGKKWQFRFINDVSNSYRQQHPWSTDQSYNFDGSPQYGNNDGTYGYDPATNRLEGTNHIEYFTNAQIANGQAGLRGFIDCNGTGGFDRGIPISVPNQIGGFMITNSSGVTYHYALPAYSYGEIVYTQNKNNSAWSKLSKPTPYAYTWYLTAITGPDYVDRGTVGLDNNDWGYWVKFDYGKWTDNFNWRNPADGQNSDIDPRFTSFSHGTKQLYYLDAIHTRSHTALFVKEIRADGKGLSFLPTDGSSPGFKTHKEIYCSYGGTNPDGSTFGTTASKTDYPAATLKLKEILLFKNSELNIDINTLRTSSSNYNHAFSFQVGTPCERTDNVHYGKNVIDSYDVAANSYLEANCLRRIAFNYDYSLCPGTPNSYDPTGTSTYIAQTIDPTQFLGKLSLLSIDFQGKGGIPTTPPIQFQYDLDPSETANQGNISITQATTNQPGTNQTGVIQAITGNKFNIGDILSFQIGGKKYWCTLLSSSNGGSTFKVLFLNDSPGPTNLNTTLAAVKTKNPPYNKDTYDNWLCYKSDYLIPSSGSENLSRFTTPVSDKSTDVWSLRKIISSIGANINIDYEGNTFDHSVLNNNNSIIVGGSGISNTIAVDGLSTHNISTDMNTNGTIDFVANNPQNIDLTQVMPLGSRLKGSLIFYREQGLLDNKSQAVGYQLVDLSAYPNTKINSINGNNINVSLDPNLISFIESAPLRGGNNFNTTPNPNPSWYISKINLTTGNIIPFGASDLNYGGGIRVKNITVDDLNGGVKQTSYNYRQPGVSSNRASSSGVTSYLPAIFDQDNLETALNGNIINQAWPADVSLKNDYKKILYKDINNLLAISREVPSPGVMYEYITVTDNLILPDNITMPVEGITPYRNVPIEGKTVYQYEVFKSEMIGIYDYNNENPTAFSSNTTFPNGSVNVGLAITSIVKKDRTIKDYTSRIGNLKRVITYDDKGNKLAEKINHYLHDDVDNTTFNNQINNYEPHLANFNGVVYNDMGVIIERYGNARFLADNLTAYGGPVRLQYTGQSAVMLSNKETFPSIQTGTTQIDYKNGTRMDQTNLAYDFYTGAVTKILTTDSYGNRFIDQITPAYQVKNGTSLVYPALGLKTHDDDPGAVQHKQMLLAPASNYRFSADINNLPIGVVAASAKTWSNSVPVLDPDGNTTTVGQDNIWRMEKSFAWLASGTAVNNTTPYTSFIDYFSSAGSGNAAWKKTSQFTKYNVYSNALEAIDIDSNYAANKMGYSNSKVIIDAKPARYNEIAYTGVEDALLTNGNFSNNISKGGGTIVNDSTKAHTGINALMVPGNANGFTYTVPISSLSPIHQNYSVAVWVKPTASNFNQAQLYYQSGTGTSVAPTQTYAKTAAGWYLLEMLIPSNALTSGNLVIGCKNASANALYFDDFRIQPTAANASAYIYDNKTGELNYIIGNNNLYTRFQYDAIGRLVRVYKEVLGKTTIPRVRALNYHYKRSGSPPIQ